MLLVIGIALVAFVACLVAVTLALDLRAALRGTEAELREVRAKLRSETATKVEALIQLRDVRHRACSVCRTEDAYLHRRVQIRRVA